VCDLHSLHTILNFLSDGKSREPVFRQNHVTVHRDAKIMPKEIFKEFIESFVITYKTRNY
jgi:hypothetical protein